MLEKRLEAWTPPKGPFDPVGAWTLRYARHALIPERDGMPGGGPAGSVLIEQKPGPSALRLIATESVAAGFSSPTYTADIRCAHDALLTPQSWTLDVRWLAGRQANIKPGELDQTRGGRVEGREIVHKGAKERRRPAPERWTSLWNLFAVVPRLPFDVASALAFDLFEELDLHKPEQRLAYIGPQTVTLKGQTLALHVFEQTGRGVLPWHWWLDEQHRVVLASGGQRAYLLDATAKGGAA
jgi:hypothetical protein